MSSVVHSTADAPSAPLPKASPPKETPMEAETPITQVMEETGTPYLIKHLEADLAFKEFDQETKENAQLVEEQFLQSVKKGKYRGDKVSYQDFLRHLENVTDTKHAPAKTKINVIAEFLRYSQRREQYA